MVTRRDCSAITKKAAYARSDLFERRRRLMDDWAAYLYGEPRQVVPPGR